VPTFGNFFTLSFNLLGFFGRIFGSVSLTLENVALFNTSAERLSKPRFCSAVLDRHRSVR
jgi:hypothetical protein